jgi:hypothetical protein
LSLDTVCIAQVCDHLENNNNIINVTGVLLFSYASGAVCGPPIVAACITLFSVNALFYYLTVVGFLLFICSAYYSKGTELVLLADQVEFVIMPRISPIANELNPTIEESDHETVD